MTAILVSGFRRGIFAVCIIAGFIRQSIREFYEMANPGDNCTDEVREHPAYKEGAEGYDEGLSADDCPHKSENGCSPARTAWMFGWYGARTDVFIRKFDEKWDRKFGRSCGGRITPVRRVGK